jgi:hypothetical protein
MNKVFEILTFLSLIFKNKVDLLQQIQANTIIVWRGFIYSLALGFFRI